MSLCRLSEKLYISSQISDETIQEAAKAGITTVICNRPDGEEETQPAAQTIQAKLAEAGIPDFHHLPVVAPNITADDSAAFSALLEQSPGPVLAYCRTGTRSSILWAISQAKQGRSADEIIAEVKEKTGWDLSNFAAKLV